MIDEGDEYEDEDDDESEEQQEEEEVNEMRNDEPFEDPLIDLSDRLSEIQVFGKQSTKIIKAIKKSGRSLINTFGIKTSLRDYKKIQFPTLTFSPKRKKGFHRCDSCLCQKSVAVDQENNIIVCNRSTEIQSYDERGRFVRSVQFENDRRPYECESPDAYSCRSRHHYIIALCISHENKIFAISGETNEILMFDSLSPWETYQIDGDGNVEFDERRDLCVDHLNRIIVCDTENNRIQIMDVDGNHLLSFGSEGSEDGQFNKPEGITVNHLNNIIVCDTDNHRIQMFDEGGNHLLSFGSKGSENGQFNRPRGIAVDQHNNILVSDTGNNRIQVFDPQGEWISSFGSKGEGEGQFNGPQGIAVDHLGRIIISDARNERIQIF